MTKAMLRMLFAVLVLLGGWQVIKSSPSNGPAAVHRTSAAKQRPGHEQRRDKAEASPASLRGGYQLYVEPQDGFDPVYRFIAGARRSLDMEMYELVDSSAEQALAAAAERGVTVRVVLDRLFEQTRNTPAYDFLQAHGVHVAWSSSRYEFTHEKAMVADGKRLMVLTANLTSRYYATTRDVLVSCRSARDAAAFESVFDADFAGRSVSPTSGSGDLVWSPGSEPALLSVIADARHTLAVENEEMADPAIVDALVAAARRGVKVTVVMTDNSDYASAFSTLRAAGVDVSLFPDSATALYIHAKIEVADAGTSNARSYVGSINYSYTSTHRNRELGLLTSNAALAQSLAAVVNGDAAAS